MVDTPLITRESVASARQALLAQGRKGEGPGRLDLAVWIHPVVRRPQHRQGEFMAGMERGR